MMSQSYTSHDLPALEELLQVAPVPYCFFIEALDLDVGTLFVGVANISVSYLLSNQAMVIFLIVIQRFGC
jgi:hypothetical protein